MRSVETASTMDPGQALAVAVADMAKEPAALGQHHLDVLHRLPGADLHRRTRAVGVVAVARVHRHRPLGHHGQLEAAVLRRHDDEAGPQHPEVGEDLHAPHGDLLADEGLDPSAAPPAGCAWWATRGDRRDAGRPPGPRPRARPSAFTTPGPRRVPPGCISTIRPRRVSPGVTSRETLLGRYPGARKVRGAPQAETWSRRKRPLGSSIHRPPEKGLITEGASRSQSRRRPVRIWKRGIGSARSTSITMPSTAPPAPQGHHQLVAVLRAPFGRTRTRSRDASRRPCRAACRGRGPATTRPSASLTGNSKPSRVCRSSGVKVGSKPRASKSVTNQLVFTPSTGALGRVPKEQRDAGGRPPGSAARPRPRPPPPRARAGPCPGT